MTNQLKAIVAGLVAVVASVLTTIASQPNVQNGWKVFWWAVGSYIVAHLAVYVTPNTPIF